MRAPVKRILAAALACLSAAACGPFSESRLSIEVSDEVTLACTLSVPDQGAPHPAVILISGSGWQTRDCDLWGFRVFEETAHHLSSHGIAVLRCDDRGVAGSTGNPSADANTTLDFADDVLAQLAALKARPELDGERIGLLGQSEGAIVAAMVDARSDDVEFVVLVAAPAVPMTEVLDDQLERSLRLKGVDEPVIAARLELWRRIWDAIERDRSVDGLREELRTALRADFERMPREQQERFEHAGRYADAVVRKEFSVIRSRWGRFLLAYDPRSDQIKMDSRVLALYGGKDSQVVAGVNAAALEETLRAAGTTDFEVKTLNDANHLFQRAVTGAVSEYAELPAEFAPGYLESIAAWVLETG